MFSGNYFFWGGGGGGWEDETRIADFTANVNTKCYGLKNRNWGVGFLGTFLPTKRSFGGFDYCLYREIFVYIFFFALSVNYAYYHSRYDQGNETKSTTKLSNFHFQWTKTLYSNISTL